MKNIFKLLIAGLGLICIALVISTIININADTDSKFKKLGKIFKVNNEVNENNDDIIAIEGKDIQITENTIDAKVKVYIEKGVENPEEAAIKDELSRQVLYAQAQRMGFLVTDDELNSEIEKTKKAVKKANNYDQYKELISGYGDEDTYWNETKENFRISMSVNKYLKSEETKYYNEQSDLASTDEAKSDGWNKYKEELVTNLINNEHISIKSDKYKNLPLFDNYEMR